MNNKILLYIEGKNVEGAKKTLYYVDGTIEIRDSKWRLLETSNFGRKLTMLDMENMFNKIYVDATPPQKEKLIKERREAKDKITSDSEESPSLETPKFEEVLKEASIKAA